MFTSTRGGSVAGRAQNSAPLELRDYERILRLLEDCGSARSLGSFRETVLEGLARHLGYRNATFFVGATPAAVFADPEPVTTGRPSRMVPAYVEMFNQLDPFARLARRSPHPSAAPLSLDSFTHLRHPDHREYLDRFLFRHGIHAKVVIPLRNQVMAGGIGLLAEEAGTFGPSDMARAMAVMPHLANFFMLHTVSGDALPISGLTVRQTEIARMAVNGTTNRQIAQALFITVDTVKKHLTSVYDAVGCTNRTELAAKWHTSGSRPLPASSRHQHIPELYS